MEEQELKKRLYVRAYEPWAAACRRHSFEERALEVRSIPRGIILSTRTVEDPATGGQTLERYLGGVCDAAGRFVTGLRRGTIENPGGFSVVEGYDVAPEDLAESPESVIFGGVVIGHFGHFLLEGMGRLWYVLQHGEDRRRIVITTASWERKPWFEDFFRLLGIDPGRILYLEQPTRFREVTVPEESVHSWGYSFTKEFHLPYQAIRDHVKPGRWRKVYLTRRQYEDSMVTCCNEQYFEEFFARHGFTVFAPEQHPLAEQISAVREADEIAGTLGTLSHFALFAKPGVRLIWLVRDPWAVVPAQCLIHEAMAADWYFIDVSMNFLFSQRDIGVLLLGTTSCWRRFVQEQYGEPCGTDTLADGPVVADYLRRWCRWMAPPERLRVLDAIDQVVLFNRFYLQLLEESLPPGSLIRSPKEQAWAQERQAYQWRWEQQQNYLRALEKIRGQTPMIGYEARVLGKGWLPQCYDGQIIGRTEEPSDPIDGLRVRILPEDETLICCYSACHPASGWSPAASKGDAVALDKSGEAIYGIRFWLTGPRAAEYSVRYRAFTRALGWSPEASDHVELQSGTPLTAFTLRLVRRDAK